MAKSKAEKHKQPRGWERYRQTQWPKSKGRKSRAKLNTLRAKEMCMAQDQHFLVIVYCFDFFFSFFCYFGERCLRSLFNVESKELLELR